MALCNHLPLMETSVVTHGVHRNYLPIRVSVRAPDCFRTLTFSAPPTVTSPIRSFFCPVRRIRRVSVTPPCCSVESTGEPDDAVPGLGLLIEVEGVLADVHRFGNRQAFNVAFQNLGLDCAIWTEPVYLDLTRRATGDEERMLVLFFNRIGWPTSLPTKEKGTFMKSLLQKKRAALDEIVQSGNLPLRPGVEDFIDDAINANLPVVVLTAYSKNGDKMSRFVIEKLGVSRVSKIKVVGQDEVEGSLYYQLVQGKGVLSSLDDKIAKETQKAVSMEKQRIAKEVAAALKLNVDIATNPPESMDQIINTLRAGAEYAGLPVQDCVLIAGSQSGVLGAERIGMSCVVIRSSLTSRAEFHSANAIMDGFGGADLTITKLRQKI
ncbi:Haloacid dehalogenase-like hydrolase (HAD) superfamily [Zostera marina]|uniref:Haloacid dehalogenase-like hydrolase (HAD) superfamily n=1 Tax=Zostera marina TaxID=29655 RepID=A0A0K9P4U5_ZOSMR|nr:Haloacid dehalogenase-like hydrolase (HAD) superfamily [Zostera marina]